MRRSLTALAVAAALALPAVPAALSAEFSDAQREEIGAIVREYLIRNPEVLREAFQALEEKEQLAQAAQAEQGITEHAADIFRSADDPVIGNPMGSVVMVEFFDYNCGYCKRSLGDVLRLIETDKDLKVVLKEFPILSEGSRYAARAALASRTQGKYLDFHLALLSHKGGVEEAQVDEIARSVGIDVARMKTDMSSAEVERVLDRNEQLAQALGINGTPAFIIDRTLVPGSVPFAQLAGAIAAVREAGGCKVC